MKIAEMLDAAKHAKGVETDYALAKSLGLPKQRVSDYYKGKTAPDEFACMQIAIAIGKPLDEVIAAVKVETEKDEKRREAWENYMKRLGGIAASFMAIAFSIVTFIVTITPETAMAQGFSAEKASNTNYAFIRGGVM